MSEGEQVLDIVDSRIDKVERELKALRATISYLRFQFADLSSTSVATGNIQEVEIDYTSHEKEK